MRFLAILGLTCLSLLTTQAQESLVPASGNFNNPDFVIKSLAEKIVAEPEGEERIIMINYLAAYLILLSEKKDFPAGIFLTLNHLAPSIAKLRVGAPIFPSDDTGWKTRFLENPHDIIGHRPFLSYYFCYFFEIAKKTKGAAIPDYTGPVYRTL